jgi:A/G-specific adenine glycosylase
MSHPITTELLKWFYINKRDLPWRKTKDPYFIWLSEIIFQQTRISQGIDYYLRFVEKYPDIFSLASASEDEVLKLWQGLGYYSRARNMLKTARQIVAKYKGTFPSELIELLKLKGIGEYTASVILSVCFEKPYAVIDGNVNRLISRLNNIHDFIDVPAGQKKIREEVYKLIDDKHPGDFNEAMMDFGAMVCTPQKPECNKCPLQSYCLAYKNGTVALLPMKSPKRNNRKRCFHYFLIKTENGILLKQRTEKDIWHNLFDLPMIELNPGNKINKEHLDAYFDNQTKSFAFVHVTKHKLTHQELTIYFYEVAFDRITLGFLDVGFDELHKYAVPKPIENFLKRMVQLPK